MREREKAFGRFVEPMDVVGHFRQEGDLDEKDALLKLLVTMAQSGDVDGQLSTLLLLLGLWGGLDGVFRRRSRLFRSPEEAAQEITDTFLDVVQRADMTRIHRVAATIVRNTERVVVSRLERQLNSEREEVSLSDAVQVTDPRRGDRHSVAPQQRPMWGSVGAPPEAADPLTHLGIATRDRHGRSVALRSRFAALFGADAELIYRVLVLGETQREAAEGLQMTHDQARKRYQRALSSVLELTQVDQQEAAA